MTRLLSLCIWAVLMFLMQCGLGPTASNDTGSTTEIVVSLDGDLVNEDGTRAVGTTVYLRPKDCLAQVSAKVAASHSLKTLDSTFTDSLGHFYFDSIAAGTYMVECLEAEADNGALIDSVVITDPDLTIELATDTLKPLGGIVGQVQMPESLAASQIRVFVYGLNRVVVPNSNGEFTIPGLAEGTYSIRFEGTANQFRGFDVNGISVVSGDTALPPKIILPGADQFSVSGATGPIAIDGIFDEASWNNAHSITFGRPGFSENVVVVKTLWDSVNLYIAYEVADTMLGQDTTSYLFYDDAVEFYLDPLHDPDTITNPDTVFPVTSTQNADDLQFMAGANGAIEIRRGLDTVPVTGPVSFAIDTLPTGYSMEIAIPWSFIGTSPAAELSMGALFANDDHDSAFVDQIDWLDLRSTNYGYKNPRYWGILVLKP